MELALSFVVVVFAIACMILLVQNKGLSAKLERAFPKEYNPYTHYKGGRYYVVGHGINTETSEEYVIYTSVEQQLWVRPKQMFYGEVFTPEYKGPRFVRN